MPDDKQVQAAALSQSNKGFWIVLVILVLLLGVALFWWFGKNSASSDLAKTAPEKTSGTESGMNQASSAGTAVNKSAANQKTDAGQSRGLESGHTEAAGPAADNAKKEQAETPSRTTQTESSKTGAGPGTGVTNQKAATESSETGAGPGSGETDSKAAAQTVARQGLETGRTKTAGKAAVDAKGEQTGEFAQLPKTRASEGVIDLNSAEKNKKADSLMEERKARFGVEEKMDMVARSDETVRIGEFTVPLDKIKKEIQEQKKQQQATGGGGGAASSSASAGDGTDKTGLVPFPASEDENKDKVSLFGIYVVKPGDNIWNIHFGLLKLFFDKKGIPLPPMADEPLTDGHSSGVGRILKFSEKMVHIYNLLEGRLDDNLNMIRPLTKIVVYNMEHLFHLFDKISPNMLDRVEYDGQTLWLPKK